MCSRWNSSRPKRGLDRGDPSGVRVGEARKGSSGQCGQACSTHLDRGAEGEEAQDDRAKSGKKREKQRRNQGVAGHPRCCSSLFGPDGEDGRCCAALLGPRFLLTLFSRWESEDESWGDLARSESISSRHSTEVPSVHRLHLRLPGANRQRPSTAPAPPRAGPMSDVAMGSTDLSLPLRSQRLFCASAMEAPASLTRHGSGQGLVTRAEQAEWDLCGACPCSSILLQPLGPRRCLGEKCLHIRALASSHFGVSSGGVKPSFYSDPEPLVINITQTLAERYGGHSESFAPERHAPVAERAIPSKVSFPHMNSHFVRMESFLDCWAFRAPKTRSCLSRLFMICLGVRLDLRSKDFSCVLVANKPGRAREISESVAQVLASGQVITREVDSLFGRIQHADSQIMGRRGKLALSTLRNLVRDSGVHRLSDSDREAFEVLKISDGIRRA